MEATSSQHGIIPAVDNFKDQYFISQNSMLLWHRYHTLAENSFLKGDWTTIPFCKLKVTRLVWASGRDDSRHCLKTLLGKIRFLKSTAVIFQVGNPAALLYDHLSYLAHALNFPSRLSLCYLEEDNSWQWNTVVKSAILTLTTSYSQYYFSGKYSTLCYNETEHNLFYVFILLTNSMDYGTRMFNAAFTSALQ